MIVYDLTTYYTTFSEIVFLSHPYLELEQACSNLKSLFSFNSYICIYRCLLLNSYVRIIISLR